MRILNESIDQDEKFTREIKALFKTKEVIEPLQKAYDQSDENARMSLMMQQKSSSLISLLRMVLKILMVTQMALMKISNMKRMVLILKMNLKMILLMQILLLLIAVI
jgi:hypothetical protein